MPTLKEQQARDALRIVSESMAACASRFRQLSVEDLDILEAEMPDAMRMVEEFKQAVTHVDDVFGLNKFCPGQEVIVREEVGYEVIEVNEDLARLRVQEKGTTRKMSVPWRDVELA